MKRLVFCFDGTWNKLNEDTPTNVVLTAASIMRTDPKGTSQIIHYDEGVGTGKLDKQFGGMFGSGLVTNVREAFRFLIFNYDPGDEIYVFGFSRGAFSPRSFVGLLRHVGPLHRLHTGRIDEAMDLYRQRLDGKDGASEDIPLLFLFWCEWTVDTASTVSGINLDIIGMRDHFRRISTQCSTSRNFSFGIVFVLDDGLEPFELQSFLLSLNSPHQGDQIALRDAITLESLLLHRPYDCLVDRHLDDLIAIAHTNRAVSFAQNKFVCRLIASQQAIALHIVG